MAPSSSGEKQFILLILRTSLSTLFPYTTLFRSCGPGSPPSRSAARYRASAGPAAEDRKSTRLNSSHSQISYAVFCLKKKKTRQAPKVSTPKIFHTPYAPIVIHSLNGANRTQKRY